MSDFGLYWWRPKRGFRNLGDEISPLVLGHVSGRRIQWAEDHLCDGIAIGSVFNPRRARAKKRLRPLFVWGAGTLAPAPCDLRQLSVELAALRGPRTAGQIEGCPDLPFGDPGLFAREIWQKTAGAAGDAGAAAIGLIPHHSQLGSPVISRLAEGLASGQPVGQDGVRLIDFTAPDIAASLRALSGCRMIVSSSLHGLILADSYGIPSLFWNEGGVLSDWKYRDYFEGVGREGYVALNADQILARHAAGEDLPVSQLSEARLQRVLVDLRAAARQMPEGSF